MTVGVSMMGLKRRNKTAFIELMTTLADACCQDQTVEQRPFGMRCLFCPLHEAINGCRLRQKLIVAHVPLAH